MSLVTPEAKEPIRLFACGGNPGNEISLFPMTSEPSLNCRHLSSWQERHDASSLQVAYDWSLAVVTSERPSRRCQPRSAVRCAGSPKNSGPFHRVPVMSEAISDNNTALKTVKPQNKKGLTETMIFPSAVCFTLNSISFCAVASATVTYNSPMQVTSCAARFLEFMSIVSSNLYTAPCLAFSQIPDFSASDFVSPTIVATELEFLTA